MGREAEVLAKLDGHCLPGVVRLESDVLHLKTDRRVSVRFAEVTVCTEQGGWLTLEYGIHRLELHLGTAAAKWRQAIVSPPPLSERLGVGPGVSVAGLGFEAGSFPEYEPGVVYDLVLLNAPSPEALGRVRPLRQAVAPRGGLWIVYPRGGKAMPESLVRAAAGTDGWVDVKTCRFDEARTALKFVRRR